MDYSRLLRSASLFEMAAPYRGKPDSPMAMGVMARDLVNGPHNLDSDRGHWEAVYLGRRIIDGRTVFATEFRDRRRPDIGTSTCFFLDPSRGYLPARVNERYKVKPTLSGEPKTQVFLIKARECSGQRWFPERTLIVDAPEHPGDRYDVKEIKVISLDVDSKPSDDDFKLEVPAGTQVHMQDKLSKGFFRLKQDEKIGVNDLPGLLEMLDKVKSTPLMDTAVKHRRPYFWLRWLGGGTGAFLVVAAVTLFVRRRRALR